MSLDKYATLMKVGVKVTPELFAEIFRTRSVLQRCTEGIPEEFKLRTYGHDLNEDVFFFIFAREGCQEAVPVDDWVSPDYEVFL